MLMAGIDGIQNKIDPGDPADFDLFELDAAEAAKIKQVPSSLAEALDALEADHDFLLKGLNIRLGHLLPFICFR